jgi:hypothetical protein
MFHCLGVIIGWKQCILCLKPQKIQGKHMQEYQFAIEATKNARKAYAGVSICHMKMHIKM